MRWRCAASGIARRADGMRLLLTHVPQARQQYYGARALGRL
jgi:hypothetical protein